MDSIDDARVRMGEVLSRTDDLLREQRRIVKDNQLELISRLESLKDTDKYMRLITDENIRIQKELEKAALEQEEYPSSDPSLSEKAQVDIRINTDYLDQLGLSIDTEDKEDDK